MTSFSDESHCNNCDGDDGEHKEHCFYYIPPFPEDFDTLVAHTVILWRVYRKMLKRVHNSLRSEQIRKIHRLFMDRLVEMHEERDLDDPFILSELLQIDLDMFLNRWGE